eukprot:GHRR01012908.1.p1 GENE.GHRR01012908.1~~GHRR01012908.1.p1  ORF type:complete len:712 (+),score=258.73 GHRR01012908.1:229-2364(+)
MAYGFWYRSRPQMQKMGLGHVASEMVDQLEETWGVKFETGYNSDITFMGHLWEPLIASWRPLAFYLATELVGWCARQLLKRWGFEHHKHNGLSYFTLNMVPPRVKPITYTRATSSSTLADMAAAAAVPGSAARTVPGAASGNQQLQQQQLAKAANSTPAAAASDSNSFSNSRSSSRSASPTKTLSRGNSGLLRSKSSPFEAGPPDWTPFADPADPCNAVARKGSVGFEADAGSAAGAGGQTGRSNKRNAAAAMPATIPGLTTQTSVMLRSMANPLQGALSDGLGSADTPVLFLHGVGGLPGYLEMILHVMGLGHPVIVVEFKGVSMRLGRVYSADEVADTVVGVLDKLGIKEACVVGHSYGTFIAGLLARHHQRRVHTLCVIDPVCFGMFMPHLLYNFLYRVPQWRGCSARSLLEYVKDAGRLVASRDMHVCATFARRFYWSDLNLWPEDLPPGSVVLLSGKDDLMDAAEVKDMLDVAGHVKVMYNSDLTHGAFLLDTEVKQAIMAEMRGLLARSGSAVVGLAKPVLAHTLTLMTHGFTSHGGRRVSMKKGGKNGRYYVEDHSNQLVRTFTGNLTKMLAKDGAGNGSSAASSRDSKAATDGSGATPDSYMHQTAGHDWSASKLMQTFSQPVRRKLGIRSWGHSDGDEHAETAAAGAAAGRGGDRKENGTAAATARVGRHGSGGAGGKGIAVQPGVERIDEGEVVNGTLSVE